MSTVAPPLTPSQRSADPPQRSAAEQLIQQRIEEARRALWWSELTRTCLMVVIGSMLALLVWLVIDHWVYSPGRIVRTVSFVALVSVACWFLIRRAWPVMTSRVTSEYAAWALEQDHPDYRQQLTSYVTLKDDGSRRGVRARVVRAIGTRAASLLKSHDVLPREATGTFRWWITAAAVFALLAAYFVGSPKSSLASAKRLVAPLASIDPARRVQIIDVRPGDAEALAGRDLEVSADVDGLRDGEPVICRWATDGPTRESELVLDPSSNRFAGMLSLDHAASGIVRYTIQAGDAVAGPFELNVENVPVVAIESVRYQPPAYTQRKPRTTSSPAITAIDGTKIRITAKTNRPIVRAELEFNPKPLGDTVRATAGRTPITIGDDKVTLISDVTLRSARGKSASVELESYRIRVWDSNDQSNPDPIIYPIKVIADLPPEVAIVVPKKSPIEIPVGAQQIIEVHAMDADFELQRVTLRIERGIDTLEDPIIWVKPEDGTGKGNQVMEYRFRPLEHLLRAGDVVRISATAIDNRAIPGDRNVQPNQTTTDAVEIRIVEDAEQLPQDPTGNDGLSRPDDQPASDVQKSQQGDSQQGSDGQGGQGQSGQSQGDQSQESDGQNTGGQGSGETESTGENQEPDQGDQGGGSPSESADQNSAKDPNDQSGTNGPSNSTGQSPPSEQAGDASDPSMGEPSENQTDSANDDPNSQPPKDQQAEAQSPSNGEQTGAAGDAPTDGAGDAGGQSQSGDDGPGSSKANGSEPKSKDGTDSTTGDNTGTDPQQPSGGKPSKAPPEHDGQAFERIKDYIEKQKQNQPQNSSSGDNAEPSKQQDSDISESGDSATDPSGTGKSESGPDAADSQTPKSDGGEQESPTGESPSEQSSGEQNSSEQNSGEQSPSGEGSGSGDPSQPDPKSGEQATGEQGSGEQESGETQAGQSEQGNSADSNEAPDSSGSGSEASQRRPNEQDDAPNGESGSREGNDSPGESGSSQSGDSPAGQSESPNASSGSQGSGTGTSENTGDAAAETPPPPDLNYAKKATDMVLDYLDETRDQVDEDLLKELDWSEQDLQRFRERWEQIRKLDQPTQQAESTDELQDALRSLGLQQRDSPGPSTRDSADSLRNLRDSGNRRKAPPAIRDAFDAFRRRQ